MAYIGIDPNVGDISFQTFTGDGSTTTFTLAQSVASGEAIIVTIGNVVQEPGASAAYVAYANTLTFSAAPANGDVITVRYFGRAVDQPLSYGMQLFKYVATASQTVFTGADSSGTVLAFSGTDVDVYLNGVHLDADDFTASSGDTITLAAGATLNDELVIRAFRAFTITDTVSASSGGTFNGAVTFDAGANFGDNDKAIFGAGSDLQIYHNGSDSYITDVGTGSLHIRGQSLILEDSVGNDFITMIDQGTGGTVSIKHLGSTKLATTATGVDVTGILTADRLDIDYGVANASAALIDHTDTANGNGLLITAGGSNSGKYVLYGRDGSGSSRFYVSSNGDISFYDSTGVTQGFFWDASTQRLGLGTTSPAEELEISADAPSMQLSSTNASGRDYGLQSTNTGNFAFYDGTAGVNRIVIDSSGNVGIGTTSPDENLQVFQTANAGNNYNQGRIKVGGTTSVLGFQMAYTAQSSGRASLTSLNPSGTSNNRIYIGFGALDSSGEPDTSVMTLNQNGAVGIKTNSPEGSYKLDVRGWGTFTHPSGDCNLKIQTGNNTGFSVLQFGDTDDTDAGYVAYNHASNYMSFRTNGSGEDMRITSNGELLVGTTSQIPSGGLLQVKRSSTARIISTQSYNTSLQYHHTFMNSSGTFVGAITVSTTATTYATSSDYRLKTAVNYDWDATTRLKQLRPARFKWISDGDDAVPVDGFLAHEVQDIVPEAINGTKDAMMDEEYEVTPAVLDEDGNVVTPAVMGTRSVPDYQGIDQSKLTPLLTKALIEAVEKIEQLEARITALEAN